MILFLFYFSTENAISYFLQLRAMRPQSGTEFRALEMKRDMTDKIEEEEDNVPEASIEKIQDSIFPGVYTKANDEFLSEPSKRWSRRRKCNLARITTKAFVEFLRTGRLCGRRVINVRLD